MTSQDIYASLAEKSLDGQAWVAVIMPFATRETDIHYHAFKNPSSVPDRYITSGNVGYDPMIGWNGKVRPFSQAATVREQNRGITCE